MGISTPQNQRSKHQRKVVQGLAVVDDELISEWMNVTEFVLDIVLFI